MNKRDAKAEISSDGGFLSGSTVSIIIAAAGAAGSLIFMLRAGTNTPRLLLIGFVFWILSPFAALIFAIVRSKRWPAITRTAIYCLTPVISLGSFMIYGEILNVAPQGAANAFRFVIVSPVSWLLIIVVITIAALISRKKAS